LPSALSPLPGEEDALRRDVLLPGGRAAPRTSKRTLGDGDAVGARVRVTCDPAERDLEFHPERWLLREFRPLAQWRRRFRAGGRVEAGASAQSVGRAPPAGGSCRDVASSVAGDARELWQQQLAPLLVELRSMATVCRSMRELCHGDHLGERHMTN